jgi:hypothetical protein
MNKLLKVLLFPLLLIAAHTMGQTLTNYAFQASAGTYTPLSGATVVSVTSGTTDDGIYPTIPIGFDFWYLGNRYTTCGTTTNGILSFPSIGSSYNTNNIQSISIPLLAPLWDDMDMAMGTFSYKTEAIAGDSVFTAQWSSVRWTYTATAPVVSFQVKLYRNTGKIVFIYRPEAGIAYSPSASIGIAKAMGSYLSLNNTSASPSVSSSTPGNALTGVPASGQTYSFTPNSTITNKPATGITKNSAVVGGIIDNPVPGSVCGVVVGTSSMPVLGDAGVLNFSPSAPFAANYDITATGLASGTLYYYRAYIKIDGTTYYSAIQNTFSTKVTVPYTQDFESSHGGWSAASYNGGINEWAFGTPVKGTMGGAYSGINAWTTNLTGLYSNNSHCVLVSPAFDFSGVTADPVLSFMHAFKTEEGYDAMVAEISTDGGTSWSRLDAVVGTGSNFNTSMSNAWYNSNSSSGNIAGAKFTSTSNVYSSRAGWWIESKTTMTGAAGNSNVLVRFRFSSDGSTNDYGCILDNIAVRPAVVPVVASLAPSDITPVGATLKTTVTSNGGSTVTAIGVIVSTASVFNAGDPGVLNIPYSSFSPGAFHSVVSGLQFNTRYYFKSYATNAVGTSYGPVDSFTTLVANLPVVSLSGSTGITPQSARLAATITDPGYGVYRSGIVISKTSDPKLGNAATDTMGNMPLVSSGPYSILFSGLSPSTKYYFRAYAGNVAGVGYSDQDSFTTAAAIAPSVKVYPATVTATSGILQAEIMSTGGSAVSSSGILVSNRPNVVIGDTGVINLATSPLVGSGTFTLTASGLTEYNKYYYRAYAINAIGTAYSVPDSFAPASPVTTFPYFQNFDSASANAWTTSRGTINGWKLGTPAKTIFTSAYSAPNAWVTSLNGNYTSNHDGAVISPVLDFSTFTYAPVLEFMHRMETETTIGWDAGIVEISVNGGAWTNIDNTVGTGSNYNTANSTSWYNTRESRGPLSNIPRFSGSTQSYSSAAGGWIKSRTLLAGAQGQNNVRIRFRFAADGVQENDGWMIDDVKISRGELPVMSSVSAWSIGTDRANLAGRIVADGGAVAGSAGIVISTQPAPVIGAAGVSMYTATPDSTGSFSMTLSSLSSNTLYYYRTFATSAIGTGYSATDSFITKATVPFSENFEGTAAHSWTTAAIGAGVNNWQLGTPVKTTLGGALSGSKAWATKLSGEYDNNCHSSLISPVFNIKGTTGIPVLKFMHTFTAEAGWDGMVVEVSVNGGPWTKAEAVTGTGSNFNTTNSRAWYNSTSSSGPLQAPKFSDRSNSYSSNAGGWIRSSVALTAAAGADSLRFRFTFGTDGSGTRDGWIIDDVELYIPALPVVSATPASNITYSAADLGGTITSDGNGFISASGVVISKTTATPAIGGAGVLNIASSPVATSGTYTVNASGLKHGSTYYFRSYAINGTGTAYSATDSFTLPVPPVPVLITSGSSNITHSAATLAGEILSDSGRTITASGIIISTLPEPEIGKPSTQLLATSPVAVSGSYNVHFTSLLPRTTYYYRAYATNSAGTGYSMQDSFTTTVTIPSLSVSGSSSITPYTATLSGYIVSNGGDSIHTSGVLISAMPDPFVGAAGVTSYNTSPVVTYGALTVPVNALAHSTTYYYRFYAISNTGTGYSAQDSFVTLSVVAPAVGTRSNTVTGTTAATLHGTIIAGGRGTISASGILVSTTPDPVLGDAGVIMETTTPAVSFGAYTVTVTGLTQYARYYYRAFATNEAGTGYGATDSFYVILPVTTLPYVENFDGASSNSWTTGGAALNNWEKGTPSKSVFSSAYSAPNAWVTKLSGNYNDAVNGYILSPIFNMSSVATDPVLQFRHRFITERDWDAGVVEVSVNEGPWNVLDAAVGTGSNYDGPSNLAWYNLAGSAGPLSYTPKFTGNSSAYSSSENGWILSQARLTGTAGQANVRFRFRFASDLSGTHEGWMIDDVAVFEVTAPTVAPSAVTLSNISATGATVSWTKGNGSKSLVVARPATSATVNPTDWTYYKADSLYGWGDATGADNFVVYSGTGNAVNVKGLDMLTDYTFTVYEFNGNAMHVMFGAFVAHGSGSTLPVTLLSFNAVRAGGDVKLSWNTASETVNKGFDIERSEDGRSFEKIGFVKGAGTVSYPSSYTFNDNSAFAATGRTKLYYRLRQVDENDAYAYSAIVSVQDKATSAQQQVSVAPNPFSSRLSIGLGAMATAPVVIRVTDIAGKEVFVQQYPAGSGSTITIDELGMLKAGVYYVTVSTAELNNTVKVLKR